MGIHAVVLDACVLYPAALRDTLLRAAEAELFRPHWSAQILDEVTRNLIADGRMSARQAERLVGMMSDAFPEAMVAGYQSVERTMTNHPKDRHVLAAAVVAQAGVIVTFDVHDFPSSSLIDFDIVVETPDQFLTGLVESAPQAMLDIVQAQAADLVAPPLSSVDLLRLLERQVPLTAQRLLEQMQALS